MAAPRLAGPLDRGSDSWRGSSIYWLRTLAKPTTFPISCDPPPRNRERSPFDAARYGPGRISRLGRLRSFRHRLWPSPTKRGVSHSDRAAQDQGSRSPAPTGTLSWHGRGSGLCSGRVRPLLLQGHPPGDALSRVTVQAGQWMLVHVSRGYGRNAKLIFRCTLRLDGREAGIYRSREMRGKDPGPSLMQVADPTRPGVTRQVARPKDEWVAIVCPAIISEDLFEAAGRVSRDNSKWSPRRAEPGTLLLRRLVSCGTCQVHLVAHRARQRSGGWIRYYSCPNHDRMRAAGAGGYCPERRVRADEIDAFVFEAVRAVLADPAMLIAGEAALVSKAPAPDDELLGAQPARLDRRIQTADAERRRLADLYQAGLVELEELTRRATELDARRRRLAAERSALFDQRETLLQDNQLRRRIAGFAERVTAALPTLDFDQRQQLLRTVVEDVSVRGWEVEIRLRIPVDALTDDRPKARSRHRSRPAVSRDDGLRFIGQAGGGMTEAFRHDARVDPGGQARRAAAVNHRVTISRFRGPPSSRRNTNPSLGIGGGTGLGAPLLEHRRGPLVHGGCPASPRCLGLTDRHPPGAARSKASSSADIRARTDPGPARRATTKGGCHLPRTRSSPSSPASSATRCRPWAGREACHPCARQSSRKEGETGFSQMRPRTCPNARSADATGIARRRAVAPSTASKAPGRPADAA